MGRREEALRALNVATASRRYNPGDATAHVHVALGGRDDTIRELERACQQRSSSLHLVGIAPEFAPMRSDPRFVAILERIGLEPDKVFASAPHVVRETASSFQGKLTASPTIMPSVN
jgi:hypothetical protein